MTGNPRLDYISMHIATMQLDVQSQIFCGLLRFPDESDEELRGRMKEFCVEANFVQLLFRLGVRWQ